MDYVSRCAQAIENGDWDYLADKACQPRNHAIELERAADTAKATDPPPAPTMVSHSPPAQRGRRPPGPGEHGLVVTTPQRRGLPLSRAKVAAGAALYPVSPVRLPGSDGPHRRR